MIITAINEIKKIVVTIIIKSSKYSIKLNVIYMTKKNISRTIRRVLNTQNMKKTKLLRRKNEKSSNLMFVVTTLKLKLRK